MWYYCIWLRYDYNSIYSQKSQTLRNETTVLYFTKILLKLALKRELLRNYTFVIISWFFLWRIYMFTRPLFQTKLYSYFIAVFFSFFFFSINIYCRYLLISARGGDSNTYPQHLFHGHFDTLTGKATMSIFSPFVFLSNMRLILNERICSCETDSSLFNVIGFPNGSFKFVGSRMWHTGWQN